MTEKCKKRVYRSGGRCVGGSPCARDATRDGWCFQHHPEKAEARRDASHKKYEAEWAVECAASNRGAKLQEFGSECAKWLGTPGAAPLSSNALYTGPGPDDRTFGEAAAALRALGVEGS